MMTQQIVGERTRLDHHTLVNGAIHTATDKWTVWHDCTVGARRPVEDEVNGLLHPTIADSVWAVLVQTAHAVERKP